MSEHRGIIKVAIIGDAVVGKTCLLQTFLQQSSSNFRSNYNPTTYSVSFADIEIRDRQLLRMNISDTSGIDSCCTRLRYASYKKADAIIVCFSVDQPITFEHAMKKWISEVSWLSEDALIPIIVVGLKSDLRDINNRNKSPQQQHDCDLERYSSDGSDLTATTRGGASTSIQSMRSRSIRVTSIDITNKKLEEEQKFLPSKSPKVAKSPKAMLRRKKTHQIDENQDDDEQNRSLKGDLDEILIASGVGKLRTDVDENDQFDNMQIEVEVDPLSGCVVRESAEKRARKAGANIYLECSAKTEDGVMEVFEKSAELAALYKFREISSPSSCNVM